MRRIEKLESRMPLTADLWDVNPGFYGSQIEPVRLVDDWLYLEATVGDERRLMKTDGDTLVDIGAELPFIAPHTFLRGSEMIGVTETGVAAFDFATDTITLLSDRPGGKVLDGKTVMWYVQDTERTYADPDGNEWWEFVFDYQDLEGRTFHFEGENGCECAFRFSPVSVFEDALFADIQLVGMNIIEPAVIRGGIPAVIPVSLYPPPRLLDGQLLFEHNIDAPTDIDYVTESDNFVMKKPEKLYDFGTGAWIVDDGVISRYDDGVITTIGTVSEAEWDPEFSIASFWDANELVFSGRTELWGPEPYKATLASGIQFMGNYGFGTTGVAFSPLGTYGAYQLMRTDNTLYLYDGDQFIKTALDAATFMHMSDTHVLVKVYTEATGDELLQYEIPPGDADLDGIFNSSDLVHLFALGEYEDALVGNSSKITGDFNGDGEFDTNDLVLAFQAGLYEAT